MPSGGRGSASLADTLKWGIGSAPLAPSPSRSCTSPAGLLHQAGSSASTRSSILAGSEEGGRNVPGGSGPALLLEAWSSGASAPGEGARNVPPRAHAGRGSALFLEAWGSVSAAAASEEGARNVPPHTLLLEAWGSVSALLAPVVSAASSLPPALSSLFEHLDSL